MRVRAMVGTLMIGLAALGMADGMAVGQTLDVAIVAAAGSATGCAVTDPQSRLMATGLFARVDYFNVQTATPTLAQLQAYDAVLVWTNNTPLDNVALGNVLADYVDGGGGVVVSVFANSTISAGRWLGGRWQNGYEVIMDQGGTTTGHATLGTVLVPGHAIMAGVLSFDGGTLSYRPTTMQLAAGSVEVARWSDGRPLVVVGANERRVDLGFYPPSAACATGWWVAATDGARLMAQSLAFAAGGVAPPCLADADGNGQVEPADVAMFVGVWFGSITGGTLAGDFDHSGAVEPADVAAFVGVWFAALSSGC